MRHVPTPAEELLWQRLRGHQLGVKFQRQYHTEQFSTDFVCFSHKVLVVLADTGLPETEPAALDKRRFAILAELGYRILSFSSGQVLTETEQVLRAIEASLR